MGNAYSGSFGVAAEVGGGSVVAALVDVVDSGGVDPVVGGPDEFGAVDLLTVAVGSTSGEPVVL